MEATPERLVELERRHRLAERPFDPEVPPIRYARPHHFAVNPRGGPADFEAWLREADQILRDRLALGVFDLPALGASEAFGYGFSPSQWIAGPVFDFIASEHGERFASETLGGL